MSVRADMSTKTLVLAGTRVKAESVLTALSGRAAVLDSCVAPEMVVSAAREGISGRARGTLALELVVLNQTSGTIAATLGTDTRI